MGWLKIDDKYPRNPKVLAGDIETAWYFTCALTHAAEQLTDGYIAASAVTVIAPHVTDPRSVAERCADLGMFQRVDSGYLIPDFLEFNPSRADVMDKREKDRKRQEEHRKKSQGESRSDSQQTSDVSPGVPSRPVPTEPLSSSVNGLTTPRGDDEKLEAVVDQVVKNRADRTRPKELGPWSKTVRKNLRTDDGGAWWAELERLMAEFPTAPVSMLAAAADGEKSPHLKNYRRQEAS